MTGTAALTTIKTTTATAAVRPPVAADKAASLPRANSGRALAGSPPAQAGAVVVHSGARDAYQVARALDERGLLVALVTDLYCPAERPLWKLLLRMLPGSVAAQLLRRREPALASARVHAWTLLGLATLVLDKLPRAPFAWRRGLMRHTDAALGTAACRRARALGATVLSYSYYGYQALADTARPGMLFQLHPHPASMRQILAAELAAHPDCAESLGKEWELALPEEEYRRLVVETRMAAHTLVASSFTRDTLIEHGTPAEAITVVPYGVNCERFSPAAEPHRPSPTLRLLFVGRINQRKGIKYLLEALRLLDLATDSCGQRLQIHLTVCGRVVDSLEIFKPFAGQVEVRPDVSQAELVEAYRGADLFVFPSVAEGFGHVLLEALACGLPVLSTTHTAAPDLIEEGVEGWSVEPGRADLLAERIAWAAEHRAELQAMRGAARQRAESFTWARFRKGVAEAFLRFSEQTAAASAGKLRPGPSTGSGDALGAASGAASGPERLALGQAARECRHV